GTRRMLYAPDSLVFAVQMVPRSVSPAVTFAPLIGAPLGSVTVPTIAAVTSLLHAGVSQQTCAARAMHRNLPSQFRFITKPPHAEVAVHPAPQIENGYAI